ncbi:cationic amino acid transporter [Psychrobacter sp. JCM 18900]|nr:cationic amino acid transporter [Psychrobacter sp. JCM 18900]
MLGSVIVTWLNIRGMEVSAWFQKNSSRRYLSSWYITIRGGVTV